MDFVEHQLTRIVTLMSHWQGNATLIAVMLDAVQLTEHITFLVLY